MQIDVTTDERSCPNCYYEAFNDKAYPCSRCIHNKPSKDMFQPKTKYSLNPEYLASETDCGWGEVKEVQK